MKRTVHRTILSLFFIALSLIALDGCQSKQTGAKPGEDLNNAMTPQQKALLSERKKQGEQ